MTLKVNFTWDIIHTAMDTLAYIAQPLQAKRIVAIARGGLIPATMLSHRLNIREICTITAEAYEGSRRTLQKPIVVEGWKPAYALHDTIIIDDIMDTGDTWDAVLYGSGRHASNMNSSFFTIVKKDAARFINFKHYFAQVPADVWVKFPWEGEEG